ncbi:heptaprenyl diphosphate synthase component 1 [Salsuginibacillus kocurii]|uniref:heptaprenyl diphosphate synthase component 1 n=1 Tax=Salsuginibacillus kocurii TaxID=427078 RepID=UPI00035F6D93|nr:heptaprenyl diphosphate synthase component 1 [Salsuginibacillus kocurii]
MSNEESVFEHLSEIEDQFRSLCHHPYVARHIEEPEADRDHIIFLADIIQTPSMDYKEKEERILSALLVQAALDSHEQVELTAATTDQMRKNRQLTVLAGDYFSSLYFHFLAKLKDTRVVRVFSHSIQRINEQKMRLHQKEDVTLNGLVNCIKETEAGLLVNLSHYYDRESIGCLASLYFGLKKVKETKKMKRTGESSPLLEAVTSRDEAAKESPTLLQLEERFEKDLEEMVIKHQFLLSPILKQRIENILNGESPLIEKG